MASRKRITLVNAGRKKPKSKSSAGSIAKEVRRLSRNVDLDGCSGIDPKKQHRR